MCLIMSAYSDWYSGIWKNLKNSTLLGTEDFPKTTTAAYDILFRYKKQASLCQVQAPPTAVIFFQSGDTDKNKTTPGNYGGLFPGFTCYHCQETGNYVVNFPSSTAKTRTGSQSLQEGLTITHTTKEAPTTNIINPKWNLLDTCSNISSIRNKNLVHNIQPYDAGEGLRAYTNGEHQDY